MPTAEIDLHADADYRVLVVRHADSPRQSLADLIEYEGTIRLTVTVLPQIRQIRGPRYAIRPVGPLVFEEVQTPSGYLPGAAFLEAEDRTIYLLDRGDPRVSMTPADQPALAMSRDVCLAEEGLRSILGTGPRGA